MIRVAIVEDEQTAADQLSKCLDKYREKFGESFSKTFYTDASSFLAAYRSQFDVVFMDIELPYINGMDAARKLREMDKQVALVFVTNLSRYAINGYEVEAMDYILKPLNYDAFLLKIRKVINYCHRCTRQESKFLRIPSAKGEIRFSVNELMYVEISGHNIIYHAEHGNYPAYGTMKQVEKQLEGCNFYRCNSCYLVNLRYVSAVDGHTVTVGGDRLSISHPRKKDFMKALDEYNP